jgi:hypothetical protein
VRHGQKPALALAACEKAMAFSDHDPSFYVNALFATRRGVEMKKCLADSEFAALADEPRFVALKRASGLGT